MRINSCWYFPHRDINGIYNGLPKETIINHSNVMNYNIKLYYNKINEVDESTYRWLKVHPNPWNLQFKLKI